MALRRSRLDAQQRRSEQPEPKGSGSVLLNIGVADVASARRTLEARGVTLLRPTVVIPGKVALAEFSDPDGNRLRFAGPPPSWRLEDRGPGGAYNAPRMPPENASKPRRPTAALSSLALILSFVCGGCSWASNYGPLFSLALAIASRVLVAARPDRFAGAGRATAAMAISLAFTAFALTMRPYVGSRGDLRYGRIMEGIEKVNRPLRPLSALRTFLTAEHQYATLNAGFFDTPECLVGSPRCLPGSPSVAPKLSEWPPATDQPHFTYVFYAGRAPTAKETAGQRVSPSSMVEYAVTVTPKSRDLPSYCADSTLTIRSHRDGRVPKLVDGLCDPAMPEVP